MDLARPRCAAMGFFFSYFIALASAAGIYFGGVYALTGFVLLISINVLLDEYLKEYEISSPVLRRVIFNPTAGHVALYLAPVFLPVFWGASIWGIARLQFWWQWLFAVIATGMIMTVIGTSASHELIHRRSAFLRGLGVLILSLFNLSHFRITHIEIHHRFVGTDQDPSTAKADINFWSFLIQNYFGNFQKASKFEAERVGFWNPGNRLWHYVFLALGLAVVLGFWLGPIGIVVWLAVSLVTIAVHMSVEFIEHKGLVRETREDGQLEPLQPHHSVDCYYLLSNLLVMNCGLHAHHHLKASSEFVSLGTVQGAEKMPYGYGLMALCTLLGLETSVRKRTLAPAAAYTDTIHHSFAGKS